MSQQPPRIHFSGIGGIAMVAGARLALEAGWDVRGSDNPLYPPASEMVRKLNAHVYDSYDSANLKWKPDVVVVGNALSRGNPEIETILEQRMFYMSLPEWLRHYVLRERRPVAVCGTHGKTTTSAYCAYLLNKVAATTPGYLIGGQPLDFEHSSRLGSVDAPFVIEGDEYDSAFFDKRAKFFHYMPEIAVVTSLEFDHGDIYGRVEDIERAFQLMLRQMPGSGKLILCADSPRAAKLREHAFCNVFTYGFSENADYRIVAQEAGPDNTTRITVQRGGKDWDQFDIPLFGKHNLRNALATLVVGVQSGMAAKTLKKELPGFKGVKRRMEIFHEGRGVTFIDDFAHHPTAVRQTVRAVRKRWPGRRLVVLFEPRSNTTVTNLFQREMGLAFKGADRVWLGPLYRPERLPDSKRLDRDRVVADLDGQDIVAAAVDDVEEILAGIDSDSAANDVVLILSNGAFGGIYDRIREVFK